MTHTGAMIAIFPDPMYLGRLSRAAQCMPGSQPLEDLHITVCYLGTAADLDKNAVITALQQVADALPVSSPLLLRVRGLDRFSTREDDGTNAIYARIICPELHTLRDSLITALASFGVTVPQNYDTYTPHMTLGYAPEYLPTPNVRIPLITIPAYTLRLDWADETPIVISTEHSTYALKHGKHNQASHGRKGRAGRAGGAAYAAARAGGASHQEAQAAGMAATAAERDVVRAETAQRRTDRLNMQAARARAAANGTMVTPAQAARLNAKADRLEARARGEKVGPKDKPVKTDTVSTVEQPFVHTPVRARISGDTEAYARWREDKLRARAELDALNKRKRDLLKRKRDLENRISRTKEVSGPMASAAHGPDGLFSNPALGSMRPFRRKSVTTKPFASQAQQRFAFGSGQPWAKRWADETDFRNLPPRVPKEKAYNARAGEVIAGNLVRGNDGKFTSGSAGPAAPKPKKPKGAGVKPKKPKTPKPVAVTAPKSADEMNEFMNSLGLDPKLSNALSEYLSGIQAKEPEEMALNRKAAEALQALGLIKIRPGQEGSENLSIDLTGSGKRLQKAVGKGDTAQGMRVVEAAHTRNLERQPKPDAAKPATGSLQDRLQQRDPTKDRAFGAKPEEKPKGGGGGGGGGKKDDPADPKDLARIARAGAGGKPPTGAASGGSAGARAPLPEPVQAGPNREAAVGAMADRVGIGRAGLRALRGAASGDRIDARQGAALVKAGFVQRAGDSYEATDQGRQALSALERGNARGWQSAVQNAGNRLAREVAAQERAAATREREDKRPKSKVKGTHTYWKTYRMQRSKGVGPREARRSARETVLRQKIGRTERRQSGLLSALYQQKAAVFTVFKTPRGLRWLAISSNNYEDRDREIVSKAALDADVARTAQDGRYGPLRWWHLGEPDPLAEKPWGPGLDLGMCDFAAMDGPFLIESGTFDDPDIGAAIAAKASKLALSIGFFHPRGEPDADGVFHHIRRFERSLAPAGKVSNPLTAFYVPGATPMAMQDTQLKALADLLPGIPEEKIKALIAASTTQATKTAEAAGLRYKADGVDDKIAALEGQIAALKAEMKAPEADLPPAAAAVVPEEDDDPDGDEETYAGDMTMDQFKALIGESIEKALSGIGSEMKALTAKMNMAEKMGGMFDEMKAMFGGIQQKDASKAERIETLETAMKVLVAELSDLRGDQPAAVVAASKSARTALPDGTVPDTFTVKTPDDKPAYAHPADAFGAWIESATA